jgi:hypothetical protein
MRGSSAQMKSCEFGVVRKSNGNGSITVYWPNGGNRVIFFEAGTPAYFDRAQADSGAKMSVSKRSDTYTVRIGGQYFEIPEAIITGG